jgi:hypothetical protein
MAMKTKGTRKEWTKNDLRSLKQYSREKLSVKKISRQLKRTEGALRTKAHGMGLALGQDHSWRCFMIGRQLF